MKRSTLLVLLVVAAVLVTAAVLKSRQKPVQSSGTLAGTPVLPGLQVNDVAAIEITGAESSLTLARKESQWGLPGRFNYPVDFGRVRDLLVKMADLKIGQVMRLDDHQKTTLKLVAPGSGGTNTGTRIRFLDAGGRELAALLVGESRKRQPDNSPTFFGGYPDGQYVSPDGGKSVYLVGETLFSLTTQARDWFDAELLNVASPDLQKVTIAAAGADPVELLRKPDGQGLELQGLSRKEETDGPKASALQSSLSFLRMDDVADPALADTVTGMDKPVVFEAVTTKGEIYRVKVGMADPASNRYVRLEAALTPEAGMPPPPPPGVTNAPAGGTNAAPAVAAAERKALEDKVAAFNLRVGPWTYLLAGYKTQPFTYGRNDLVLKKSDKDKEEAKQDDAKSSRKK